MDDIKKPEDSIEPSTSRPTIVGDTNKVNDSIITAKPKRIEPLSPQKQDDDKKEEITTQEEQVINELTSNVTTKRENELAEEKELARQTEVEELIASKKYYLPIKQHVSRTHIWVLSIVVIVVVAIAGAAAFLLLR